MMCGWVWGRVGRGGVEWAGCGVWEQGKSWGESCNGVIRLWQEELSPSLAPNKRSNISKRETNQHPTTPPTPHQYSLTLDPR